MNRKQIEKTYDVFQLAAKMSKQYYNKPLIVCYSGGKDSDVILKLAKECLKSDEFEVMNSHTTVDAPETVYHIRNVFKKLNGEGIKATVKMPEYKGEPTTMWKLIPQKGMPPKRIARYCCSVLKEASAPNRFIALGVRGGESSGRRGRDVFGIKSKKKDGRIFYSLEHAESVYEDAQKGLGDAFDCRFIENAKANKELICNPIYEWSDTDVWDFIFDRNIEYNPLYKEGYTRIGCIGCPLSGYHNQMMDFKRYPKYKDAYIRAFDRMIEHRRELGKECNEQFKDGESVMKWWLNPPKYVDGQLKFDPETGEFTDKMLWDLTKERI